MQENPMRVSDTAGRPSWDAFWLGLAKFVAESRSKDPSTKVGCVVVDRENNVRVLGYNGIPRGVSDSRDRLERPAKYLWTGHAEENAVAQAARSGIPLGGCTAYVTACPCSRCARMLIQSGIARVVYDSRTVTKMDACEFDVAKAMFSESGILVTVEG